MEDIVNFLRQYRWVYDFKWTDIYSVSPWENIPANWSQILIMASLDELKSLMLNKSTDKLDVSFRKYLSISDKLTDFIKFKSIIYKSIDVKKINPKKDHEISNITDYFQNYNLANCDLRVLDIGSGLGHLSKYLSKTLQSNSNISVLAVEGNEDLHERCDNKDIDKLQFYITKDNLGEFENQIQDKLPNINFIIGLHCCGSLSSSILEFYRDYSNSDHLLLLSCCYHRMTHGSSANQIQGFPMSQLYKTEFMDFINTHVSPYFLRLACQESKYKWLEWTEDDYWHHRYSVGFRSAVACFHVENPDCCTKKLNRIKFTRLGCSQISFMEFSSKFTNFLSTEHHASFQQHLTNQIPFLSFYSIMLFLQMCIQETLELFILQDRVEYLRENCESRPIDVCLTRIFDPRISPRSIGIVAENKIKCEYK